MGSKTITKENVTPVLSQLKDHLVGKNVAADIAAKLCDSIALKLEGKVSTGARARRKYGGRSWRLGEGLWWNGEGLGIR